MTKHVCKISRLNSKRLLRKLQKLLRGYFILPHPVYNRKKERAEENTGRTKLNDVNAVFRITKECFNNVDGFLHIK